MRYYIVTIFIFLILYSCGSRDGKEMSGTLDSLKSVLETSGISDTVSGGKQQDNFDNILSSFGKNYNISPDWSKLGKTNSGIKKDIKGKLIIIPVTNSQVNRIINYGFSDSSVVFTGNSENSFVFEIDGSRTFLEKIPHDKNGLLLLKVKNIEESSKLYLVKQGKDFRHSEMRVTEYVLKCDIIDAAEVNISSSNLLAKFNLKEF